MSNKRLAQIERRIKKIKEEIMSIGEMRPGSLTKQYKDRGNQTGAYHQISYTLKMKSRTDYIRSECVADVRQQIKNYKRFKKLSEEWIALGVERSKLLMKIKKDG